jgi:hypothetical protein
LPGPLEGRIVKAKSSMPLRTYLMFSSFKVYTRKMEDNLFIKPIGKKKSFKKERKEWQKGKILASNLVP